MYIFIDSVFKFVIAFLLTNFLTFKNDYIRCSLLSTEILITMQ